MVEVAYVFLQSVEEEAFGRKLDGHPFNDGEVDDPCDEEVGGGMVVYDGRDV